MPILVPRCLGSAALGDVHLEATYVIIRSCSVRRATEELGKLRDVADIVALGCFAPPERLGLGDGDRASDTQRDDDVIAPATRSAAHLDLWDRATKWSGNRGGGGLAAELAATGIVLALCCERGEAVVVILFADSTV